MYPGMLHWLRNARRQGACGPRVGQGPAGEGFSFHRGDGDDLGGGGAFGVRRPLRFLAYRLNLNETQVEELAKILDELKTERAQAAVERCSRRWPACTRCWTRNSAPSSPT